MAFEPKLTLLPAPQQALWPELRQVPPSFVLYGGTGLALRLGHRRSIDFDFFSPDRLNHRELYRRVGFLSGAAVLQEQADALTVIVDRGGPVKVSFFGPVAFGRVGAPETTSDGAIRVASLLDLAGTKIKALLQRVEMKDYLDVAALLQAGVSLKQILGAACTLFGEAFNPLVAQKTLSFFEGGDLDHLDAPTRALLVREATRDLTPAPLAKVADRLD